MIRDAVQSDSKRIAEIYNYYIANTVVTFEEESVSAEEMWTRVQVIQETHRWLVFELENEVVGYAYSGGWNSRCAYRQSVETTIYLDSRFGGQGIGKKLYTALLDILKNGDAHAVIGGVALPNEASIALHESLGYKKVAHFKEVGFKMNRWIDVGYWELILD